MDVGAMTVCARWYCQRCLQSDLCGRHTTVEAWKVRLGSARESFMVELTLRGDCSRALRELCDASRHWHRKQMSLEAHSERGCIL